MPFSLLRHGSNLNYLFGTPMNTISSMDTHPGPTLLSNPQSFRSASFTLTLSLSYLIMSCGDILFHLGSILNSQRPMSQTNLGELIIHFVCVLKPCL